MDDNFAPEYQEVPRDAARHITTNYFNPTVWSQIKGMASTFIESKALPAHIQNVAQAVMVLQAGLEMGMKPMEAINSVYIVNGAANIWGKAVVRRLREHGYFIEYLEEDDQHCKAKVFKREEISQGFQAPTKTVISEEYTETFYFEDAKKSGWTTTSSGSLKVGWKEGQNRKLKMRYGVLSSIIKSYIPDVLGSASDIAEVSEDIIPIVLEAQAKSEKKSKVEDLRGERGSLGSFISKSREQVTPVAEEGEVVDEAPKKATKKRPSKKDKPEPELHQEVHQSEGEAVNPATLDKARKEYFAVTKELGYEGEDAKSMIKEFYEVDSFNDIDLNQLKAYILSLRNQLEAEKGA